MKQNKPLKKSVIIFSVLMLFLASLVFISPSSGSNGKAATLQSIQLEINRIIALIISIQERILVLLREQSATSEEKTVTTQESSQAPAPSLPVAQEVKKDVDADAPVYEKLSLPSHALPGGLGILYRFSVTGGSKDVTIPSFRFLITYSDISIKDLTILAYEDADLSRRAYSTVLDYTGKRAGFLDGGEATVDVSVSDGSLPLVIRAKTTRYFELRGTTSGRNVSAYVSVMLEGFPKEEFR